MRVIAAAVALTLATAGTASATPTLVTFTATALIEGLDGSFATGTGSVLFDPATFPLVDDFGGQGNAMGGSLTLTGLLAYGATVDTTEFTMPGITLDVDWYPVGCSCGNGGPEISFSTGVGNQPPFTANADGYYLVNLAASVIGLIDFDPAADELPSTAFFLPFETRIGSVTEIPEPDSVALLALGLGLAGLTIRHRAAQPGLQPGE